MQTTARRQVCNLRLQHVRLAMLYFTPRPEIMISRWLGNSWQIDGNFVDALATAKYILSCRNGVPGSFEPRFYLLVLPGSGQPMIGGVIAWGKTLHVAI